MRTLPALLTVLAIAGCGGPRFDAAAAGACEAVALGMPGSVVATAFVTTLGRIRTGGYDLEDPDRWPGKGDPEPATVCAIDTPSLGGPDAPTRMVVAIVAGVEGSKIIKLGAADTLPLPTP